MALPSGNIELYHCTRCSMVWNKSFDNTQMQYDSSYEETQGCSPTFQAFHQQLARYLIDQYALGGKSVIEIGCGKGGFLALLSRLGIGQGFGFDPSFDDTRISITENLTFSKEFFPPQLSTSKIQPQADFYVCKMTLEHIDQPRTFLENLRSYIGKQDAVVAIQVPAFERIVSEHAYWDIYYEHCNYFSNASLTTLLELTGFSVIEASTIFDRQYLNLVARTAKVEPTFDNQLNHHIDEFSVDVKACLANWHALLTPAAEQKSLLIWGAASKAVGLLNALPALKDGTRLVDINPKKQGSYLPSTEIKIEAPDELKNQRFDIILIANPVYLPEVTAELARLNIRGKVITLSDLPLSD